MRPFERELERLDARFELVTGQLARVHRGLLEWATSDDPALLERLSPEPPQARRWGYGLLPEISPSPPTAPTPVERSEYSLKAVKKWLDRTVDRTEALAADAARRTGPVEPLVDRFDTLRRELRRLEKNLSYHRFWQPTVIEEAVLFEARNRIAQRVREWQELEAAGGDAQVSDALRHEITRQVAPFYATSGLALVTTEDGTRVLPVEVASDIEDEEFLEVFRSAVADAFEHSEAARSRRFRISLEIAQVTKTQLYPEGAPAQGAQLDERDHLSRFPKGSLVLTTGAQSTHARTGRYIQLGPHPRGSRTLAHEFGHLLGFDDGYLRSFEGTPDDPYGVVLVEWTGLLDDLMGAPGQGRVTEAMIDRLIESYGRQ